MPSAIDDNQYSLTEEQKAFFLEHGFLKLHKCFSREAADKLTHSLWARLGASPTDKLTWPTEKMNMPGHVLVSVQEFAPKAWSAIKEMVGGEERVADWVKNWKDGWIVNFGKPEFKPDDPLDLRTLDNWHVDGDFFVHFLDSPEQALLVIPLFSDIEPRGGGTAICTDGIGLVAKHLYNNPDGTNPALAPHSEPETQGEERRRYFNSFVTNPELTRDESFHEATGEVGDVYLLHPFMLHSASKNLLRNPRIITNPPVALKEPFNFNRKDPSEYSLVEQKTLRDLGRPEGLPEWKITSPRQALIPARIRRQEEMKRKEMENMKKQGIAVTLYEGAREHDEFYPS